MFGAMQVPSAPEGWKLKELGRGMFRATCPQGHVRSTFVGLGAEMNGAFDCESCAAPVHPREAPGTERWFERKWRAECARLGLPEDDEDLLVLTDDYLWAGYSSIIRNDEESFYERYKSGFESTCRMLACAIAEKKEAFAWCHLASQLWIARTKDDPASSEFDRTSKPWDEVLEKFDDRHPWHHRANGYAEGFAVHGGDGRREYLVDFLHWRNWERDPDKDAILRRADEEPLVVVGEMAAFLQPRNVNEAFRSAASLRSWCRKKALDDGMRFLWGLERKTYILSPLDGKFGRNHALR